MNWADERYVRIYIADTADWMIWPWQSRALFPLLIRKASRTGVVPLGKYGTRGLGALVGLPPEVVAPGLDGLLEDGCVVREGDDLVVRNFVAAQETTASDALRAKTYRQRMKADPSRNVTPASQDVTDPSRNVTPPSRVVTDRHGANGSSPRTGTSVLSGTSEDQEPSSGKPDVSPLLPGTDPPEAARPAVAVADDRERVVTAVLERWRSASGMAKASIAGPKGEGRRRRIRARIRDGFTEADLVDVSAGALLDAFLMGTDPKSKPGGHRDVDTWFRDAAQCERLMALARGETPRPAPASRFAEQPTRPQPAEYTPVATLTPEQLAEATARPRPAFMGGAR